MAERDVVLMGRLDLIERYGPDDAESSFGTCSECEAREVELRPVAVGVACCEQCADGVILDSVEWVDGRMIKRYREAW